MSDRRIERAWWALRLGLGVTAIAAGADKFFNLLTDWEQYLSPAIRDRLPTSEENFMKAVGVVEIAAGALILSPKTRLGAYAAGAWLLGISANLLSSGEYYDIAARDINMAVGAFALGQITEAKRARTHVHLPRQKQLFDEEEYRQETQEPASGVA